MYQKTRIDAFREKLFTLRDALFDYIYDNHLSYDLPAYRAMRRALNGFILWADKLSAPRVLFFLACTKQRPTRPALADLILNIPDSAVRYYFQELQWSMRTTAQRYLLPLRLDTVVRKIVSHKPNVRLLSYLYDRFVWTGARVVDQILMAPVGELLEHYLRHHPDKRLLVIAAEARHH